MESTESSIPMYLHSQSCLCLILLDDVLDDIIDIWLVWKLDDKLPSTPRMLQREWLHLRLAADTGLIAHGVLVVSPSRANHEVQQTTQVVAQEERSTY